MSEKKVSLRFCGGVGMVTGANFLLSTGREKILIDCGLIQGERLAELENGQPFPYEISEIGALLVTHAHLDHVGRIPKLVKEGYIGAIYSTAQTRDLAQIVLEDAAQIFLINARQDGQEPIFRPEDVPPVFNNWQIVDYHETHRLSDDISFLPKDAGHILGSAMYEISILDKKILFTGDLGNSPAPLIRDTEDLGSVDYLVMESVYGDRDHEGREGRQNHLERIIKETISKGGTLVIPAFALDRTQVLLYELNDMVESGRIPKIPVFVDSPMAIKATEVYRQSPGLFNEKVQTRLNNGDDIFSFPKLEYVMSREDSQKIDDVGGPKIILAGSGMSVGGRVLSHEANYLPGAQNTILLVGYQTAGSLGRRIADGDRKVTIARKTIKVRARVERLSGYSAHKDRSHLLEFVATGDERLKKIFVVMGETGASLHLAQAVNDELGVKAIVPELGKEYILE